MACAQGISWVPARKKRLGGGRGREEDPDKKVADGRESCVCASHATRDGYLHFYVTKVGLSLSLSLSFATHRNCGVPCFGTFGSLSQIRHFSPSCTTRRKTRTVILNSLADAERDSRATQSRHDVARGERQFTAVFKPPYERIHAAIFIWINFDREFRVLRSIIIIDSETRVYFNLKNAIVNGISLTFD